MAKAMDIQIKKFRPSNGTEGESFTSRWCGTCANLKGGVFAKRCEFDIHIKTMLYDVDHPDYPSEWQYDDDGKAVCTAHKPK